MYKDLLEKQTKLAVIGLGYVGLPIALAFARKLSVVGFDINESRIHQMQKGIDPSNELPSEAFENCDIIFTTSEEALKQASFFIITVPTPVDDNNQPDLTPLLNASTTVGKVLRRGNYVVFESTVYPGCTEEDCLPVLENESGLKCGIDFKLGYSPERINPGDKEHTLSSIVKVVSGCDVEALEEIAKIYELVVEAGVYKASSIKVAEAAKIVENSQRDLNIAFMNELSLIFDKMEINTFEVLEAAGTKWNFLKFFPGLVGGHCTGVDPYYLHYKADKLGYHTHLIKAARLLNDSMGQYIAQKVLRYIESAGVKSSEAKVLIKGATFKENVSDVRNSKVGQIVNVLQQALVEVHVEDPYANSKELESVYGFALQQRIADDYDAVIITVPHREYLLLDDVYFCSITKQYAVIADLKGIYRNKIINRSYFSL